MIHLAFVAPYFGSNTSHGLQCFAKLPDVKLGVITQEAEDRIAHDRKVLGALFKDVGDPTHPLSVFSRQTAAIRQRSIAQFEAAFATLSPTLQRPAGLLAWLAHLAVILLFIHDRSRDQERTRHLGEELAAMAAGAAPFLAMPFAGPVITRFLDLAQGIGLVGPDGKVES